MEFLTFGGNIVRTFVNLKFDILQPNWKSINFSKFFLSTETKQATEPDVVYTTGLFLL